MTPQEVTLREYLEGLIGALEERLDDQISGMSKDVAQLNERVGRLMERQRFWLHLKNAVSFVGVLVAMVTSVIALFVSSS